MAKKQILLLPRMDYYKWVRAVQKYALHFGIGITPDPGRTSDHDVVTVISAPNSYPQHGDIERWLKTRYPDLLIDVIYIDRPAALIPILDERIMAGLPFDQNLGVKAGNEVLPRFPKDRLYLFWPTDYTTILQPFGDHPEIYMQYGLPGHEGVDIRAPHGSNIYACAEGEVYLVEDGTHGHNYGRQVRIRHKEGYRTIYAHLERVLVRVGDRVKARQLIGRADSTGNSTGNHLHLTLKKDHASDKGETDYPLDIIDPTPFLVFPHMEAEVLSSLEMSPGERREADYPWSQPCLVGINIRVGGSMQEVDFNVADQARIEAARIYNHTSARTIQRLRQINPEMFFLARMTHAFDNGRISGKQWAEAMKSDFNRLFEQGVHYFEIQYAPNLAQFGWRTAWTSGEEFAGWWMDAVANLGKSFPEARFGFPGISPGEQVPGKRMDAEVFMDGADQAMVRADWLGVHCFWRAEGEMNARSNGRYYEV
ncbi:MAG: M23 family metallopeptidase, partial [Anaerolineales bacterium]